MRVVKRIDFTEISVVRKPAAEAAKAVLMKSADHKQFTGETVAIVDIGSNVLTKLATPEPAKTTPAIHLHETEKGITMTKPVSEFEKFAKEVKARDNCTNQESHNTARKERPDLYEAYQGQGVALAKANEVVAKVNREKMDIGKRATVKWEALVKSIRKRDDCNNQEAAHTARKEHPAAFQEYQESMADA